MSNIDTSAYYVGQTQVLNITESAEITIICMQKIIDR